MVRSSRSWVAAGVAILALTAIGACSQNTPPSPSTPPAGSPPPLLSESPSQSLVADLRDPHRWDCAADADCMNSCAHGAVGVAWYGRNERLRDFRECEDGCANQISAPPRCEAGSCVAYQVDPRDSARISRSDFCTRVERRR